MHGPDAKQLKEDFTYHAPNDEQQVKLQRITQLAHNLAEAILHDCPPSADRSAAYRCVREARMWANAAIVIPRGQR